MTTGLFIWTCSQSISCVFCRPLSRALAIALSWTSVSAKSRLLCVHSGASDSEGDCSSEKRLWANVCVQVCQQHISCRFWRLRTRNKAEPVTGGERRGEARGHVKIDNKCWHFWGSCFSNWGEGTAGDVQWASISIQGSDLALQHESSWDHKFKLKSFGQYYAFVGLGDNKINEIKWS